MNHSDDKRKISPIIFIFLFFLVISSALIFWYSYSERENKTGNTQLDSSTNLPVFDPTKDYNFAGISLENRIKINNKIDLKTFQKVMSRLEKAQEDVFHVGQVELRYGGVVSSISYTPDVSDQETSLEIVIDSAVNPSISFTTDFTKRQMNTINVFLISPLQTPKVIGPENIEAGDLIYIIETIDILDTEREGFVAIEIQKLPK